MNASKAGPAERATSPQASVEHREERRKGDRRRSEAHHPAYDVDPRHVADTVEGILLGLATKSLKKAIHQAVELGFIQTMVNADGGVHTDKPAEDSEDRARKSGTLKRSEEPVIKNGIRHPQFGSTAGEMWLMFAEASKSGAVTLTRARELAEQRGMNPSSAGIALYKWRKFHGVKNVRD